jgi:hypothetical protein
VAVAPDPGGSDPTPADPTRKEQTMIISKALVLSILRERGQNDRANFVDRELPERIDSAQHGGLLATLHLDPSKLAAADPA